MTSTPHIYVIDDSVDYRTLVQMIFTKYLPTYPVRFLESGQAFLEELPIRPLPSLILLDRHMPLLDGQQILTHLKESIDLKNIPVVMMSAAATEQEIKDCYRAGANSFIRKPLEFDSLKRTLTTICEYWSVYTQVPPSD